MRTEEQKRKAREATARYRAKPGVKEKEKENLKKYREANKEKISQMQKNWREKNPEKYKEWYWKNEASREKKKLKHREWLEKNKDAQYESAKLHKKRYPEKVRARDILRKAVYEGRILKPNTCEICMKKSVKIEGHHEDYSLPYNVKWLCVKCHRNLHKELRL